MALGLNQKVFFSLVILSVLAVSSLVAVPFVRGQSSSSATSTVPSVPALSSFTLTSYNGNDQTGISDLGSGKIQAYDFAVTPSELSTLPSTGFNELESPAAWYGLEINPTNTTGTFNPFQFQQVRFALNYLVDRDYLVDNLLGGDGVPTVSVFGGEPDELVTSSATAPFSNITDSITIANSTIYSALIANGATFKESSTPQWYYDGKPIVVTIFDRSDDPVRSAYDGFLQGQLEKVGFQVTVIPGTLATALTTVFSADPANSTWDIYPASYGAVYQYYDEGFAELYAPIAGAIPASSNEGDAFGAYNDTLREQPSTLALLNTADKYALDFFNTNFSSFAGRDADLDGLVYAGVKAAVVIGLATSLSPYAVSDSLSGVTANFVTDPVLNYASFLTMSTSSGTADIGVRYLAQSSLNPFGGSTDSYAAGWGEAVSVPPVVYQPSTGYLYPVGWGFSVQDDSPTASVPVPTSAVVLNATQDQFVNVASGTMAKSVVTANFAPMLSTSWQDGQPVTLADIIYQYILAGEASENPASPIYDGYTSAVFGPSWETVLGMQIVNSTSVKIYSTFYYPDSFFAGINAAGALFALTPTTRAAGQLPWTVYAGMANLVANGKDVWSTSTSTEKNLPWLSIVNPTDVANLKTALSTYASSSYIPPEFASLQSLTGTTLITASQAAAAYNDAVSFITQYGHADIGNGPFILSTYSPSTSPAYATFTRYSAFNWGSQLSSVAAAAPVVLTQSATIPAIVNPGQQLSVTALQTPDGSKTSSPVAGANVTMQLISSGAISYQMSTLSNSQGVASFTVPTSLPLGPYILSIYTANAASTLYNPLVQAVELSAASVTTTSSTGQTTTTTSSSQPTTSTSTGTSTTSSSLALSPTVLGGIAMVTAVLIAALALGSSRRRGYPRPSSHTISP
jgi:peptide/nickel transport system substrate-binding protein